MEFNKETGLPAVSEGQFWTVRNSWFKEGHCYEVQLRVKTNERRVKFVTVKGFFSGENVVPVETDEYYDELVDRQFITQTWQTPGALNDKNIKKAAIKIMKRQEKISKDWKFVGDYPPKSINSQ